MAIHHSPSHLCPPPSIKAAFKGNADIAKMLNPACPVVTSSLQKAPKITWQGEGTDPSQNTLEMKALGSSVGEVRQQPLTLNLLCEETEGLQDCQAAPFINNSRDVI